MALIVLANRGSFYYYKSRQWWMQVWVTFIITNWGRVIANRGSPCYYKSRRQNYDKTGHLLQIDLQHTPINI